MSFCVRHRCDGMGPDAGLLVLGARRRRGNNLSPLVCLVEAVKLRKDEGARACVLGVLWLLWWWCSSVQS